MHVARAALLAGFGLALCAPALADDWIVEAHWPDQAALQRAAAKFQHIIVDPQRQVLRTETDGRGIDALAAAGLTVTIDEAATAQLRATEARIRAAIASRVPQVTAGGYPSIPGFACYRTVEGTYDTMDDLAAAYPGLAEIDDIGPTWKRVNDPEQGYEMRAIHITNFATLPADPDRPKMVVFSSIHAREYPPAEIDTRFAEWLVESYGSDPEATWLVDHNDFHLVLQANPDGRKMAEQGILWRKNDDQVGGNCDGNPDVDTDGDGIDLNRNFPFHWDITNGGGSSGYVCDETYRGESAQSEPETDNLVGYVAGTCDADGNCSGGLFADRRAGPMDPPNPSGDGGDPAPADTSGFFVDVHNYASLVLWPWGDTSAPAPNRDALQTLGRRLAWYMGYTPQQSDQLYPTDGTTDDTMYGLLGVASYTIETDSTGGGFFEDCDTFEAQTWPHVFQALRYAARTLHAPYQLPLGPDTVDVQFESDLVPTGTPVAVDADLDSSRYEFSNGSQPVYPIASAAAFVDALPWDAGASPIALAAADGAFDSDVEAATGSIDTSALPAGRHVVTVQSTDDQGNAGTPNAAWFDTAAASEIGTLSGVITARDTGDPLPATVTATDPATGETRSTVAGAGDGQYARTMLAGTVDVHVAAPGYVAENAQGIALAGGQTVTRDFELQPMCTVFEDDVENGNIGWTAQNPWQIVNNVPGNATHVWDTPNYQDDLNRTLTSPSIDVTGYADFALDFDDRCATEPGYDFGYAEFSTDGGSTWTTLSSCSGRTTWQSNHVDFPSSANGATALEIRFRFYSDPAVEGAGWAIDNIRLSAGGSACGAAPDDTIFADGFDD
ncbi:MAG: M14 family zinc carboxypeptidase [Lysobacterales bacterium]